MRRRHGSPGRPDDPPERLLRFDPADYPAAETPMGAYRPWAAEVRAWAANHDGWMGHVTPVEVWAMCALARRMIPPDSVVRGGDRAER